jgi:hypothetical protein
LSTGFCENFENFLKNFGGALDKIYTFGYTEAMKTAISIDNAVYQHVVLTALRMGISRSRFFTMAAEEYLHNHADDEITRQLNEYYDSNPSTLDTGLRKAAHKLLASEDW